MGIWTVVDFQGSKYVIDRKTTKTMISSYYFDRYVPDNQMSLYTLAGRIISPPPVGRGVIIDAVQIVWAFPMNAFERGFVATTLGRRASLRSGCKPDAWIASRREWPCRRSRSSLESFPMNDKSCHNQQL